MYVNVKVKRLSKKAVIPTYSHPTDACFDFYSIEDVTLRPGDRRLVRTGIAVYFDAGWEMQIRPRSGLSVKGITIGNTPGTVDYGYTNEIFINLVNIGDRIVSINTGDRIAQGSLKPVYKAIFEPVDELPDTERGLDGWGSTGA
jgi:dUTP pyrophosphatase